jgi:hypothetical protein
MKWRTKRRKRRRSAACAEAKRCVDSRGIFSACVYNS